MDRIVPMTAAHATEVLAIYQAGIDEGNATFETRAPSWEEFDAGKLKEHRFVALAARPWLAGPRYHRSPAGACTPGSSRILCTLTRGRAAAAWAAGCLKL